MSPEEFRADLQQLVASYPNLDADDLRDIADRFERLADRREGEEAVF